MNDVLERNRNMDPITGLAVSQAIQGVAGVARNLVRSADTGQTQSFSENLRSFLPDSAGNKINEEELFAALLQERLAAVKGADAAERYAELLQQNKNNMMRADGYVPVEKAAKQALSTLEEEGLISKEERSDIHTAAFASAQLDDNHDSLFDGRGSESDNTVAEADIESALAAAQLMMANFDSSVSSSDSPGTGTDVSVDSSTDSSSNSGSGSLVTDESPSDTSADLDSSDGGVSTIDPNGYSIDGANGFVFKPESEHENKLVVLLPPDLAQKVDQVLLKDEEGNEIERGHSSGYANGGREHFRFNKAGQEYGENITVEVTLSNGEVIEYSIPDPSSRYD